MIFCLPMFSGIKNMCIPGGYNAKLAIIWACYLFGENDLYWKWTFPFVFSYLSLNFVCTVGCVKLLNLCIVMCYEWTHFHTRARVPLVRTWSQLKLTCFVWRESCLTLMDYLMNSTFAIHHVYYPLLFEQKCLLDIRNHKSDFLWCYLIMKYCIGMFS